MVTIEQAEFLIAGLLIGASLVLWGQTIWRTIKQRRALAHAKELAYLELFSQPGRPARTSKSQGKPRLYKL